MKYKYLWVLLLIALGGASAAAEEPDPAIQGIRPGQNFQEVLVENPDLQYIPAASYGSCWTGTFKVYRRASGRTLEVCSTNDFEVESVYGDIITLDSSGGVSLRRGENIRKALEILGKADDESAGSRSWTFFSNTTLIIGVRNNRMMSFELSQPVPLAWPLVNELRPPYPSVNKPR